jgi:hypothetical protein
MQKAKRAGQRVAGWLAETNSFICRLVPHNQHCCARRYFARLDHIVNVSYDGMAESGQGISPGVAPSGAAGQFVNPRTPSTVCVLFELRLVNAHGFSPLSCDDYRMVYILAN